MARSLLPAFLRACADAQLPLTGPGMVVFAHNAFQEVKSAFRGKLWPPHGQARIPVSKDDCHFVRQEFDYPRFDEYTYPSGDLQLGAESVEAVSRGEYQWILAETSSARGLASSRFLLVLPGTGDAGSRPRHYHWWKAEFPFRLFRGRLYGHDRGSTF
jgi:hypothetical protein